MKCLLRQAQIRSYVQLTSGCSNAAATGAAPVVSFVAEANAAMSAGYSVTVSGMNFGAGAVTPTATIGTSSCGTSSWASTTSVVCFSHAGESVGLDVRVTAIGTVGTHTAAFSYDGGLSRSAGACFALLFEVSVHS